MTGFSENAFTKYSYADMLIFWWIVGCMFEFGLHSASVNLHVGFLQLLSRVCQEEQKSRARDCYFLAKYIKPTPSLLPQAHTHTDPAKTRTSAPPASLNKWFMRKGSIVQ